MSVLVLGQTFRHHNLSKLAFSFNHDRYLLHIPGMDIDSMYFRLSILQIVESKIIYNVASGIINIQ